MSGLTLVVTTAGYVALVNAQHNGTNTVMVASVGVTATAFVPDPSLVALPGEIKRITTIAGGATAADTIHVTVKDTTADTYSLLGIGVYLADGTLFATYGQVTAILQKSSQATMLLATDAKFANVNAAQLVFGDTNFQLNQATTTVLGLVQLATDQQAIDGVDAQRAVVPHALRATLDDRLGTAAPTTFVKSLLTSATALAFRVLLGIKGAATFDVGSGNGLDADTLDGNHGAYYSPLAHTHAITDVTGLSAALNGKQPLLGYTAANDASVVHVAGTETIAGGKTFTASVAITTTGIGGLAVSSSTTNSTGINIANTSTGGHAWTIGTSGSAGPTTAGTFLLYDNTSGSVQLTVGAGAVIAPGTIAAVGNLGSNRGSSAPQYPLDVLGASNGRLLVRSNGANLTIDAVTASNSAYAPMIFGASEFDFASAPVSMPGAVTVGGTLTTSWPVATGTIANGGAGGYQGLVCHANNNGGGTGTSAAGMTFIRDAVFGCYFGLDTDNQLKIGGWSFGNVANRIVHEGLGAVNLAGSLSASLVAGGTPNGSRAVLNPGGANGGYISFFMPDGTRAGYIGNPDAGTLMIAPEGGRSVAIFGPSVSLSALAASGAITGASVRATGTIMAAGGFQVG